MPGPPIELVKNIQSSEKHYTFENPSLSRKYNSQIGADSRRNFQPLSPKIPRSEDVTPRQRRYETPSNDRNYPDVVRRNSNIPVSYDLSNQSIGASAAAPNRQLPQQRQSLIQIQQQQKQYLLSQQQPQQIYNSRMKSSKEQPSQNYRAEEVEGRRIEIGLENLGNTCFMNSTLQCLLHIKPLISYFLEGKMDNDLNPQSPKKGMLATSFNALVRDVFSGKSGGAIAPVNFQRAVGIFAPYLMDFQQQDSQEFLRFLLDGMSEDLCRKKSEAYNTKSTNNSQSSPNSLTPVRSKSNSILPVLPQSTKSPDKTPNNTDSSTTTPQKLTSIQKLRNETRAMRDAFLDSQDDSSAIVQQENPAVLTNQPEVPQSKLRLVKDIQRSRKAGNTSGGGLEPNQSDNEDERSESVPNSARSKSTFSQVRDVLSGKHLRLRRRSKTSISDGISSTQESGSETARERRSSEDGSIGAKVIPLENTDDALTIEKTAIKAWEGYLKLNDSIITDIFGGLLQSTIQCSHCSYRSHTFDPFLDLSVPISRDSDSTGRGLFSSIRQSSTLGDNKSTLEKCLEKFTGEEILDGDNMYKCEKCKKNRKCSKRLQIYRYPKVLVIHIKRFRFNSMTREKLSTDVHFPIAGLDLRPYLSADLQNLLSIKLAPTPVNNNQQDEQNSVPPISQAASMRIESPSSLLDTPEKFSQTVVDGSQLRSLPTVTANATSTASATLVALKNLSLTNSSPLFCNAHVTPVYDLIGVSNHHGSLNGGHYIAHVDTTYGNGNGSDPSPRWMCFNDARVSHANVNSISGPTAYVLFYKLREESRVGQESPLKE